MLPQPPITTRPANSIGGVGARAALRVLEAAVIRQRLAGVLPFTPGMGSVFLMRPKPAERAGREQAVDETVDRRLDAQAHGALVPDRHLPERERVTDERGSAHELE